MRAARVAVCGLAIALSACAAGVQHVEPAQPLRSATTHERLTAAEWSRLKAGERVEHPGVFRRQGRPYVGGISYQLVSAAPDEILSALLDPHQLEQMLPQTQRIDPVGAGFPAPGLELEQGNDFATATYSVVLDPHLEQGEVRFWLDTTRPSDIADVHGFFRVEPHEDGRTLITVATALDVGSGLVRLLFERTIEQLILATPTRMKEYMEAARDAKGGTRVAQLP